MTLHEFAPRRIAALLCALALTMSLIPGAAFAEAADLLPSADGGLAGVATNESAATDESAAAAEGPLPVAAAYAASRMSAAALPLADSPDFSKYTVTDAVTPEGTTIDLFDYWLDTQDAEDTSNPDDYPNKGINAGHSLHFGAGMDTTSNNPPQPRDLNAYTSSFRPRQGLVEDNLVRGYPRLTSAADPGKQESLAYLFNSTEHDGKAVYPDVGGLLQVDDDGYFYYDCGENFASYDISGSNTERQFTLYTQGAVNPKGNSKGYQFFPFDTADEVFQIGADGTLVSKPDLDSWGPTLNHFFGIHMSTQFVQQDGGKTTSGDTVTYNFSGDDDVWVFIDGVLVGDLGGIHDTTSLEINFATGDVVVYQDAGERNNAYDSGEDFFERSTLKAKFVAANAYTTAGFTGDTFADGTTHTLDFFYLERGGTDSNMRLKYNLVDIPVSGIVKQDQDGKPLPGVKFALYPANDKYDYNTGNSYYTGTTNANGSLTFTKQQASTGKDVAITMAELRNISEHWVLVEDPGATGAAGDTYRLPGPIHLYFYEKTNLLLSDNAWETGTYAQPHVTVQARSIPHKAAVMFAVVMKKVDSDWLPVSGNARDGWTVAPVRNDKSIWDAAIENDTFFEVETSGAYALTIDDLPGDVTTYEYILQQTKGDSAAAQYKVQYFTADANGGSVTELNTTDTGGFTRTFSVTLAIANLELPAPTLRKTDESGTPLADVTFALYKTGPDFVKQGPALRMLTSDAQGKLTVSDEVGKDTISQGYYLLEEKSAPAPYVAQSTPIRIVVNDDGIFVYAGTATDNVTVETGIHALADSMKGFAADDDVDATLHDVQAKPQTGAWDAASQTFTWTDTSANALHLNYAPTAAGSGLIYQPTANIPGNAGTYTATEGWSRLNITQCLLHNGQDKNKQDLGTKSLNALFTGSTVIHVVNSKPATPPETTPTPQPTPAPTPTPVSQPTPQPTAAPAAVSAIPQTGDEMPVGALTALAAAAAAAFVALLVVRKRRHGKD